VLAVFEDGVNQGYIFPTRTTQISKLPLSMIDQNGNIHLVWQDGSTGDKVFYTTTLAGAKQRLDRVSLADLPALFLSGGLEAITGILLFPFAFPWMAVGLVILVVWRLMRNDEDVSFRSSQILLLIALLSYQISKLLFLPDILLYVPFSAWIDVPSRTGSVLKVAVPLLILAISLGAAEWRRRKKPSPPSALGYYVLVIIVDTVLTLAIYGVIFLGEY
jgi:hypothetical protein